MLTCTRTGTVSGNTPISWLMSMEETLKHLLVCTSSAQDESGEIRQRDLLACNEESSCWDCEGKTSRVVLHNDQAASIGHSFAELLFVGNLIIIRAKQEEREQP